MQKLLKLTFYWSLGGGYVSRKVGLCAPDVSKRLLPPLKHTLKALWVWVYS
jgi:hypothetical protein